MFVNTYTTAIDPNSNGRAIERPHPPAMYGHHGDQHDYNSRGHSERGHPIGHPRR